MIRLPVAGDLSKNFESVKTKQQCMSQNDERNFGERLIRVESRLETMADALDEMKVIRTEMNIHISSALEKLDKRIRDVERYIWIGMGGLAALQVIIAFSK